MNTEYVIYGWTCSSFSGYGVVGLNYSLYWQGCAVTAEPHGRAMLAEYDPRRPLLEDRLAQAKALQEGLVQQGSTATVPAPFFVGLGNQLAQQPLNGVWITGTPSIAFPTFEDASEVEKHCRRLQQYPLVIVGSSWNRDVLRALDVPAVLCHQGYDPALFNPSVKESNARPDGRFRVFSGGKAEYRKGQDLVLEAFSIFAEKHPDAELVAAWSSPWPHLSSSYDGVTRIGSPPKAADGSPDYLAWAQRYGINSTQFRVIPPLPNYLMPELLSHIDVAVFPNRVEGGTNLVAMECLACGVPTILAAGFGHDDLIKGSDAISFVPGQPNPFWRGSEAEPIVAVLEQLYDNNAASISPLSEAWAWPARIDHLTTILRDFV